MKTKDMAMEQSKAIDKCSSLGKQFVKHFEKIYEEGINSKNFLHHCKEMRNWYDDCRNIILKTNNKPISKQNLIDWFFSCCGYGSQYMLRPTEEKEILYEDFYIALLYSNDEISNILTKILQ